MASGSLCLVGQPLSAGPDSLWSIKVEVGFDCRSSVRRAQSCSCIFHFTSTDQANFIDFENESWELLVLRIVAGHDSKSLRNLRNFRKG